ncbi:MAG: hypothetical protein DI630_36470 [Gordonia sp. (in: high G+C Gram-positive bacteria)]|nr:MAG: hypothetical protein DI630_36470 [Gordonia sp. (in: high G+C Gram-positive bacteria)]
METVLDQAKDDCLWLLMALEALDALYMKPWDPHGTREEMQQRFVILREVETMMILRICRFDDDDRNQVGLRAALKERKELSEDEKRLILSDLQAFRQAINPMKTKVRNRFGAHLAMNTKVPHDPSAYWTRGVDADGNDLDDLRLENVGLTAIRKRTADIVHILDKIAGKRCGYFAVAGSQERERDLREVCLGESH